MEYFDRAGAGPTNAVRRDDATVDRLLVVVIQEPGDMQLLILAVPTANNGFLNGL